MKIRVLHVLNSPSIGGIESFVYYLARVQQSNPNLEIALLFSRPEGNFKEKFLSMGIQCYFFNIKAFDPDIRKYMRFAKIASRFDILHFHTYIPTRELFASRLKSKIVFTQHSVDGFGRAKKKTDYFRHLMLRNFLNKDADFVTFNSNYTKKFWNERGILNTRSKVVYNGVTFENQDSVTATSEPVIEIDRSKFIIGTSSRFINWKRIDLLVKAFHIFQKGKDNAHLLLVGDGNEMANLVELVKSLGIEDKVTFTGFTTNVTYYQSVMNVCVFPSTTESFGLVAIECLHQGKPVLVFRDGGGITELINKIDPENVVDDIPGLAQAFEKYYKNPGLLGEENKLRWKRFAEEFDMKIAENQFYQIYEESLSGLIQ
ncbi:glycosyltransferase family 4 protein [Dyadobacter sandarakinus]|uniref:Glycosyltransferase family 4 protein n=1 Tax=Dyadobacter sandarakinus TaxID=2747268 RepID=A0ABX7I0T0_9BACT|nr:glycosyltransferase family 4 protein [Dyadobacter sandarakinus]QRQ99464.1 glycosyltransferase family 4 protein [Dyadobacter sandarakinus]